MNIVERITGWWSRAAANVGMRARHEAAERTPALSNHFALADHLDARASYSPSRRRLLRSRSRYEDENCSWYAGMLTTAANHIVGSGPRLQVLTADDAFNSRHELAWLDFSQRIGFASILKTLVRADWRDGEGVGLLRSVAVHPEFAVYPRLYECDQLSDPWQGYNDPYVEDGVQIDPESGLPVAYHLLRNHPGGTVPIGRLEGDWHSAADVIHTFRSERAGQLRGVPRIAPALVDFAAMRRFERATLSAAENAANSAMLLKSNSPAAKPKDSPKEFLTFNMPSSGGMVLPVGWEAQHFRPEHPTTTFEMFVRALITKVCRCLNMPYHVAAGTSRDSNFSSANMDLRLAWAGEVESEQQRFEQQAVEKVYSWWLYAAAFAGGRYAGLLSGQGRPDDIPHRWQWDPVPVVDEKERVESASLRIETGLSSLSDEISRMGKDAAQVLQRSAQDEGVSVEELLRLRREKRFQPRPVDASVSKPKPTPASDAPLPAGASASSKRKVVLDAAGRVWQVMLPGAKVTLTAAAGTAQRRFEIVAYTGGKLSVTGHRYPVVVDLTALVIPDNVPILIDHDATTEATIGQVDEFENDGRQLILRGPVTGTSDRVKRVLNEADGGYEWQASIGINFEGEEVPAGDEAEANGRSHTGPFILATASELRETSVLPMGADVNTRVNLAAAAALKAQGGVMPTFEEWLASLGMDPATMSPEALAEMQKAFDALYPAAGEEDTAEAEDGSTEKPKDEAQAEGDTGTEDDKAQAKGAKAKASAKVGHHMPPGAFAEARRAQADEVRRVSKIAEIVATIPDVTVRGRIQATAILKGWSAEKTELAAIKETRPKAPSGIVRTKNRGANVLAAALCLAGNLTSPEKHFDVPTLDAAHAEFGSSISLHELLGIHARQGGWGGESVRRDVRGVLRAAFTTTSLPGILSNVANKFILDGFMAVEDTWKKIATIRNVNDFKAITSYRLTDDLQYEKLAPTGRMKHGALGEESYTNRAETYAKMLQISRVDIINDDQSALTTAPQRLGRGAATKLNDVFWTAFLLAHNTFFTTERGNYLTGADSVLSIDTLSKLETMFLDQKQPDGTPLGIEPKLLLVPNAQSTLATSLCTHGEIRSTTASKTYTTDNPHAGKFEAVRSSYLGNAKYGNSVVAHYLMADPKDLSMIEVCFLNGQQTPTVETADADFDQLGVQMRGYHDFGVTQQDYRAAVKSKGSA